MTTFESMGLAQPLLVALGEQGYETPTPIQMQAIMPAIEGHDLLGIAQTGTGKTAAFALPILHRLINNPAPRRKMAPRVLVLAPTRELATQIADSFRSYARYVKMTVITVFGGVPIPRQEKQLMSGVDVLVATPGRLLDLVDRRALLLDQVEMLVLDEADQMLDLGFIHSLKRIATILPRQRQSLFFSATMPNSISDLAGRYLSQPVKIEVTPVATTAERITQNVTFLNQAEKQALLTLTLRQPEFAKCLVFTRTKHGADRVVRHLQGADIRSAAIHGNKSQPQRERALEMFRNGEIGVLVATDIAARGIDIDAVSHVINFELPNVPEQYVHRIGRTARAGREGVAVSFCAPDEKPYLKDIEKLTRQKLQVQPLPENFLQNSAKLPKPLPAASTSNGREDMAHPREVGTHKMAGRRFGDTSKHPLAAHRPDERGPRQDRADRPRSDRPRTDRPRADRPAGERTYGERPQGDRPFRARTPRPDHGGSEEHAGHAHPRAEQRRTAGAGGPGRGRPGGGAGRPGGFKAGGARPGGQKRQGGRPQGGGR